MPVLSVRLGPNRRACTNSISVVFVAVADATAGYTSQCGLVGVSVMDGESPVLGSKHPRNLGEIHDVFVMLLACAMSDINLVLYHAKSTFQQLLSNSLLLSKPEENIRSKRSYKLTKTLTRSSLLHYFDGE